jgi:hypothetical protein
VASVRRSVSVLALAVAAQSWPACAQHDPARPDAAVPPRALRDGARDFDFEIGRWRTHLRRLLHPLSGSTTWVAYNGISTVHEVWGGRANLLELEVDGPAGHIEALSLRVYNPASRQWSLNFASAGAGTISPPSVGEFKDGHGEVYDQETFRGRTILVRFLIAPAGRDAYRFEQAFSTDGGRTWEVNWIAVDTRVTPGPDPAG